MIESNDPLFDFLKTFNDNDVLKSKSKKQYQKIKYDTYHKNYLQWKRHNIDKKFIKYDIDNKIRGCLLFEVYKEMAIKRGIDDVKYRSTLEYIYNNLQLKKIFIKLFNLNFKEFNKTKEHEKYTIYFAVNFWHKDGIFIKIGCTSKKPEERLKKATQTFNKDSYDILTYLENKPKTYEKELHDRFKKYNIPKYGKEVFCLEGELEEFIINECQENMNKHYLIMGNIG